MIITNKQYLEEKKILEEEYLNEILAVPLTKEEQLRKDIGEKYSELLSNLKDKYRNKDIKEK